MEDWIEKLVFDENGLLVDDDEIYKQMDKYHEDDKYEEILDIVEKVGMEHRSNKLWFRKISALNNMERYEEARQEATSLQPRCTTAADKSKIFYMVGYSFYADYQEFKALEMYRYGIKEDPDNTSGINLSERCEECIEDARDGLEQFADVISEGITKIKELYASVEKIDLSPEQFTMALSFLHSVYKIPGTAHCIGFGDYKFKYSDEEKEIAKKYLIETMRLNDIKALEKFALDTSVQFKYSDILASLDGEPRVDRSVFDISTEVLWEACEEFTKVMRQYVPNESIVAFDINELVGYARQMYACDLISEEEYESAVEDFTKTAREFYSSWEEYTIGLIIGAAFCNFATSRRYDINATKRFVHQIEALVCPELSAYNWK